MTDQSNSLSLRHLQVAPFCDRASPRIDEEEIPVNFPSIRAIQAHVCEFYGCSLIELISPRRPKTLLIPRQVAIHLILALTTKTLVQIGRAFGDRDAKTIASSRSRIAKLIATDKSLAAEVDQLRAELEASL